MDAFLGNYNILKTISELQNHTFYRVQSQNSNKNFILKLLKDSNENSLEVKRFQNQYKTTRSIEYEEILKVTSIEYYESNIFILFEDFEGISLSEFIKTNKISIKDFLNISIKIIDLVSKLHKNNIFVHNINPQNVFINKDKIKLACLYNKEELYKKNLVEDSFDDFHYIAPEQTLKVDLPIDYRTDFYLLGLIFYELLTSKKAFEGEEELELIHLQIAMEITDLSLEMNIPESLYNIIRKMLSKNPEDRYKSSTSIKFDLEICQEMLKEKGEITYFDIAKNDISDKLEISDSFYGRQFEVNLVLQAFSRTYEHSEMIIISASQGVGKTRFTEEIRKIITSKAFFITVKPDKTYFDKLFSSMIDCCRTIIKFLITRPEEKINFYITQIKSNLEDNLSFLALHIPELKLLIDIPETKYENKLNLQETLKALLEVFMQDSIPLVIVIDELNFFDSASLILLKELILDTNYKNFLVIGLLSENNTKSSVLLSKMLLESNEKDSFISEIPLKPIENIFITQFISDTFNTSLEYSEELAQILLKKTNGDFNSIKEFIKNFYNEGLIYFANNTWSWDNNKISTKNVSLNVVSSLLEKIDEFEPNIKQILEVASCIGYRFSFEILADVTQIKQEELFMLLLDVLNEEIIVIREEYHEFSHENLQNEIYKRIPEKDKLNYHALIGLSLLKNLVDSNNETLLFSIESHLYLGRKYVQTIKNTLILINIELNSVKKAKELGNYSLSLEYINKINLILSENKSLKKIDIITDIFIEKIDLCLHLALYNELEELLNNQNYKDFNEAQKVQILDTKIRFYNNTSRYLKTKKLIYQILNSLKIIKKTKLSKLIFSQYSNLEFTFDITNQENSCLYFKILQLTSFELFHTYENLFYDLYKILEKNIDENSPNFIKGYYFTLTAIIAIKNKNIDLAFSYYSKIQKELISITKLQDKFQINYLLSRFILPFINTTESNYIKSETYGLAQKTSNQIRGYYIFFEQILLRINLGENLESIKNDLLNISLEEEKIKKDKVYVFFISLKNLVDFLLEKNESSIVFDEKKFIEMIPSQEGEFIPEVLKYFYYIKALKYFFSNDFEKAKTAFEELYDFIIELPYTDPLILDYMYYYTLTLSSINYSFSNKNGDYINKIENNLMQITEFSSNANNLFFHRYLLIKAELENLKAGLTKDILEIYDKAFELAKEGSYYLDCAIICEMGAKFAFAKNKTFLTKAYISEAYNYYQKIGNIKKLKLLRSYSFFENAINKVNYTKKLTISKNNDVTTNPFLDVSNFLKILQTFSSDISFESTVEKFLKISLQNAGAQNGYLLLEKDNSLKIIAKASIKNKTIELFDDLNLDNFNNLPKSLIYFVKRTSKEIIIVNSYQNEVFSDDPYFISKKFKSAVCFPIINQGQVAGCLYLENNLSFNAFTEDSIDFIRTFISYTSVYLKNAFLYNEMTSLNAILSKNKEELEQKISERTIELIRAKELAEAATMAKSEFLANMSHEIRTPMNAIIGISDLLVETPLKNEQKDFLKIIQNNSEILLNLINDILDFSKLEAGQVQLEEIDFSLYETIESIAEILSIKAQNKGVELFSYIDPNITCNLRGDQNKIKQVLMNLIGNSIKFTNKGEIFILVESLTNNKENFESFKISIIDTGVGISTENQKKLFKKFSQADSSITRKYGGTGLGLTISKSFIELMGGDITIESQLGIGTKFNINLELPKSSIKDLNFMLKNDSFNNYEILLIEENKKLGLFLEKTISSWGFKVLTISEPFYAIDILSDTSKNFPLVIADYNSTILNGLDIIKLVSDKKEKSVKSILLAPFNVVANTAIDKSKADIVITKPIKQKKLFDSITSLLNLKKENSDNLLSENKETENLLFLKDKTILVAEDTIDNQKILKLILTKMGAEVVVVGNGLLALKEVEKFCFDLIIMDLQMPEMDGFTATSKIREFEKNFNIARVPIIAFTAHAIKGYFEKCIEMGMDDYITKPINKNQFTNILKKWIDPRKYVLIADDAEDNLFLLKNYFKKKTEYLPIFVKNGLEALNMFSKRSFSMLLMDMEMPEMDGYEAAKNIRKLERGKEIPIIALTGHYGYEEIKKCTDSGCSDYISKPIRVKDFFDKLHKYEVQS